MPILKNFIDTDVFNLLTTVSDEDTKSKTTLDVTKRLIDRTNEAVFLEIGRDLDFFETESISERIKILVPELIELFTLMPLNERLSALLVLDYFFRSHVESIILTVKQKQGRDDITCLRGFKHAEKLYNSEVSHLQEFPNLDTTLAVMRIDLDNFKRINDEHGHIFGDFVLKTVADAWMRVLRFPSQMPFRVGGDEFTVVIARIPVNSAVRIIEKIYQDFLVQFKTNYNLGQQNCPLPTFSTGIVILDKGTEQSFETISDQADKISYSIKNNGKDGYLIR